MKTIINVPFYSQKWDHEKWQEKGFDNKDESIHWEPRSCGILCLKMVVDYFNQQQGKDNSLQVAHLIKKGIAIGAYTPGPGWIHNGLMLLARELGYEAQTHGGVTPERIKEMLDKNSLVLVSIKWGFIPKKSLKEKILFWRRYGGHLALVVGYEITGNELSGLYVHHTSTSQEYNWQNKFIDLDTFKKGFTGRCIEVKSYIG